MLGGSKWRWLLLARTLVVLATAGSVLAQQFVQMPVGKNPQGIAFFSLPREGFPPSYVVVGNADDNTVTSIQMVRTRFMDTQPPVSTTTFGPIPSPAGVAIYDGMGPGTPFAVVASPTTNQIFVVALGFPQGVVSRINVGLRPIAVAASTTQALAVVSNAGDDSLTLLDLRTLSVTRTIPNVPAATSLHGLSSVPWPLLPARRRTW